MRYFLRLKYDGTAFHGWQKLKTKPTIQETLEITLSQILHRPIRCHGCGRTDAGVHALNYFAHLDLEESEADNLLYQANRMLPPSILLVELIPMPPKAHAQRDALERTYQYYLHREKDPFCNPYSLWYPSFRFNESYLYELALSITGTHDFSALCKTPDRHRQTTCTVFQSQWSEIKPNHFMYEIKGDHFIRGMIRLLVGNMLEVLSGNLSGEDFYNALTYQKKLSFFKMSPAKGLHLVQVKYPYLL